MSARKFPESFYCPITQDVMADPVVDREGNSYERSAITLWLSRNDTSPVTRSPLSADHLVPNRALKDMIQERLATEGPELGSATTAGAGGGGGGGGAAAGAAGGGSSTAGSVGSSDSVLGLTVTSEATTATQADVMITVGVPDGRTRDPADVCCVVDVSGSMGSEAKLSDTDTETLGLSLLDIVKHALKTVVHTLKPEDRFSLVSFSSTARVVLPFTLATPDNVRRMLTSINSLSPDGSTNIWDGLLKGMELFTADPARNRTRSILLLTDGVPNVQPPRGHVPMMKLFAEKHGGCLPCSISTFGFGYNLESDLLNDIAVEGDGAFAFIPDASFVGTVFVHALANVLTTAARSVTVSIEHDADTLALVKEEGVLGGFRFDSVSWGTRIHIGTVNLGQPKVLVARLFRKAGANVTGAPLGVAVTLSYLHCSSPTADPVTLTVPSDVALAPDAHSNLVANKLRLAFADTMRKVVINGLVSPVEAVAAQVREFGEMVAGALGDASPGSSAHASLTSLLADVKGQCTMAVSRADWFNKWGKHFLPSIARAHQLAQCNNFKDPGVQGYGGALFKSVRDEADEAFCKLPPPTPSRSGFYGAPAAASSSRAVAGGGPRASLSAAAGAAPKRAAAPARAAPAFSMAAFHDRHGGCFHGDCLVSLADGSSAKVSAVGRGASVALPQGLVGTVECVLRTRNNVPTMPLVTLGGGLVVTPYHPVRVNGTWAFPCDLAPVKELPCDMVYTFLVKVPEGATNALFINGVECIGLAHGIVGDAVASHPFWGTPAIVDAMRRRSGFCDGAVEIDVTSPVRDPVSGLVVDFA